MHQCNVPVNLRDGLVMWLEHRLMPGGFLTAALSNDLMQACARGDPETIKGLRNLMTFINCHAPRGSYGSPQNVRDWQKGAAR